jgi:hypothetical protein
MPGSTSTMRIYSVRSVSCQGSEAETAAQRDAADESRPQSRPLRALLEARLVRGRYRLEAFIHDHRPHGPLTADATLPAWNGYLLTVACPCGVVFERWVTPEDAKFDLLHMNLMNRDN